MKKIVTKPSKWLLSMAIIAAPLLSNASVINLNSDVAHSPLSFGPLGQIIPYVVAGDQPGTGAPVVPAGEHTSVVSIDIKFENNLSRNTCTGTVIGARHIITAAHCVDNPDGSEIDISNPNQDVRINFNDGGDWITGSPDESQVIASEVVIHPEYDGFGECSPDYQGSVFDGCLGDDIAIITIPTDIPDGVGISDFYRGDVNLVDNEIWKMVGHGRSGNGIEGDRFASDSFVKRFGFNVIELFECDDETASQGGTFTSTMACQTEANTFAEVWRADFDGFRFGQLEDPFCEFGFVCGPILGNDFNAEFFEAASGRGDSGGPSFIVNPVSGNYELIGNITFGSDFTGGKFGTFFGGNIYAPYLSWIDENIGSVQAVSAPAGLAIIIPSLMLLGSRRRVRRSTPCC